MPPGEPAASPTPRQQAIQFLQSGLRPAAVAIRLGLHVYTVTRWWRRFQTDKSMAPRRPGRPRSSALGRIQAELTTAPLKTIQSRILARHRLLLSTQYLAKLRKKASHRISAQENPDSRQSLYAWCITHRRPLPAWTLEQWIAAERAGDPTYPDADDPYIRWVRKNVTDLESLLDERTWAALPNRYQAALPPLKPTAREFLQDVPLGTPTHHLPGSPGRREVYGARVDRQLSVTHPLDALPGDHVHLKLRTDEHTWKNRNLTAFDSGRKRMADHLQGIETRTKVGKVLWSNVPEEHFADLRDAIGDRAAAVLASEHAPDERVVLLSWAEYQRLLAAV